jgi:DNA-binding transcriptional regulator YdaS (Cro superfamily)
MKEMSPLAELLLDYCKRHRIHKLDFLKRIGICNTTFHYWAYADRKPSPKKAFNIERATRGEIKFEDICDEPRRDAWRRPGDI